MAMSRAQQMKQMMGGKKAGSEKKELAFLKKKKAPKSMIKHEGREMGMKRGGSVKGKRGC